LLIIKAEVLQRAAELEGLDPEARSRLPLYGVPYAVKDNIDVAGMPTTAACPAFAYVPAETATVVKHLDRAGALLIGKTNLDQFATGLVGTRSPYGICTNPFDSRYIAGGSSVGSAVAVSSGLVSFALGTDTAGSGRVPAGFTNTVGLKPSRGLLSTSGVFPACRSLDCVSIFALTCVDAMAIFEVGRGIDATDPFSREQPAQQPVAAERPFRFGVPAHSQLTFFGNRAYEQLFDEATVQMSELGGEQIEIDFAPFIETANLLYDGPWVAERLAALRGFMAGQADELLPVTRQIIASGANYSAVDVYESYYRLRHLKKQIAPVWQSIDMLLVPTVGTIYTVAEVEMEPIRLNTNLGYYTNFANLLDLCGLAVPNGFQQNGLPMGITLLAPAFQEARLAAVGSLFQAARTTTLGATTCPHLQLLSDIT
jgi:allophanate hydrolase